MGTRKRTERSTEELLRTDPTLRLLAERITYHEQKLAEIRTALEAVLAKGNRAAPAIAAPTRRARAEVAAQ